MANVQGRLKMNIGFWEDELEPVPWIIDCIKEGYNCPYISCLINLSTSLNNKEFVSQALEDLEQNSKGPGAALHL